MSACRNVRLILAIVLAMLVPVLRAQAQAFPGYTLYGPFGTKNTYLIDLNNTVVHTWTSSRNGGYATYLLADGSIMRTAQATNPQINGGGGQGVVQRLAWDGTQVWTYTYSGSTYLSHHDVCVMPNGNVLMIAWEVKSSAQCVAAGLDHTASIWPDHIIEVQPTGSSGGNIVWQWHAWDHLIQDHDATKANYGVVGDHPELLDINAGNVTSGDWMHLNSISYNPELDQIVFSSHNLNEVYVIDHSTTTAEAASHSGGNSGKGGDFLYRWGNPANYRAPGSAYFNVVHCGSWIPAGLPGAGHIMAFNNRQGQGTSIVAEIIPPGNGSGQYPLTPGTAWAPTAPTWTYTAGGFYSSHLGGVQRLPNGNTLIAQSTSGKMLEVTSGGAVVWNFTPGGEIVRAYRYAADYPGILLSGVKVSKVEVSTPSLGSWPTISVPIRVTCLDTVRYGLDKSWFTILEDTARITNFTISCPGSGTGMCTLSYTSSCPDGAQRALSIRFSGYCSLDTTVVKMITVPRDTAALTPVHVALADVAVKDLTLATVPLNLLDPLSNQTLAPATFEVRYDRAQCEFVSISTPPGSLLAGINISETPTQEGMKFSIPSPRMITGSGKLADLVFRRVATGASVRAGLHLTGWAFASGCLKALQGDGSATYESTQRMSASLADSSGIDFGEVILGQSATRSFILQSTGEGALTIHALAMSGANAADFTAVSPVAPRVLAAGKSDTVVLKYAPAIPGAGTGTLTVQCDDPTRSSFTVFLRGSCIPQARRPVLSCSVADSGTLDFGTVTQRGTVTRTLVMTNTGSSPLQVSGATVAGANAADFAITKGGGAHTIAPGLADTLGLVFSWRATGGRSATLTLASNDSTKQPYTVFLTGTGALVDYSLTPAVTVLDFGSVVIGKDSVRAVRVVNDGRLAVPVLSQALSGADSSQFSLTRRSASTIPASGADSVLVQFRPQAPGQKTAELRVIWSDQQAGQTISVVLRGAGVAGTRPILRTHVDTLRFDTTVVGTPVHGTLVATNAGNAALVVQSQVLSGSDAARFSSQTSLPRTLQPGDTARLAYTFTPASVGRATAKLVLTSNDAVAPNTTVFLLAHAVAATPHFIASLTDIDFGDVPVGSLKDSSVLISNTGNVALQLSGQAVFGPDEGQFSLPVPGGPTILPAQSSRATLRFAPATAGQKSATFRILTNDASQPQLDIALRGFGSAPSATDDPVSAAFVELGQNYPNPFGAGSPTGGDHTTIPYVLRAAGHVTLSVRDMLGREVALLADGFEPAGPHAAMWRAGSLPAGVYMYQLSSGGGVASRTLLLLR